MNICNGIRHFWQNVLYNIFSIIFLKKKKKKSFLGLSSLKSMKLEKNDESIGKSIPLYYNSGLAQHKVIYICHFFYELLQ